MPKKPLRIDRMKSFQGSPPDYQIMRMVELQEAIGEAFRSVKPTEALMRRCHEARILAGITADKD